MIVYLGVVGVPESLMPFEFADISQARAFGDIVGRHYMESGERLYMAFEPSTVYDELEVVYSDCVREDGEIDLKGVEHGQG